MPGEWEEEAQGGAWLLGKSLWVNPEWPCVLPFLTWDLLRVSVALASEGQGSPSGARTSETLGGDQPMLSSSHFASSAQERLAGPGAVRVFRKKSLTPEKRLNPAGWMVCASQWKNSLQAGGRQAVGAGGGRAARGEERKWRSQFCCGPPAFRGSAPVGPVWEPGRGPPAFLVWACPPVWFQEHPRYLIPIGKSSQNRAPSRIRGEEPPD